MKVQRNRSADVCPVTVQTVRDDLKAAFDDLLQHCETSDEPFWIFEKNLLVRLAVLGRLLIRLFLTARHERLDVQPFLEERLVQVLVSLTASVAFQLL